MKFNFKAFILALIFCTALISAKNVYSCELNSNIERGLSGALRTQELDELYAGSSMFRGGLNLYELEKKTDRIFLLQYGGFDPAIIALLLENLIERGLVIKNFYVDMYAWAAAKPAWPSEAILFFEAPFNLKLQIWNLMKQNKNADLVSAAWEMFIQSGNDMFIFWPIYSRLAARAYHKGGNLKSYYAVKASSKRELFPDIPEENFYAGINPVQRSAIIKIINLCRENNINLTFIETPKYSATHNNKKYQVIMREYLDIMNENDTKCIMAANTLRKIHAEPSENVTSYEFAHDDLHYFGDYVHLTPEGSIIFTELLMTMK